MDKKAIIRLTTNSREDWCKGRNSLYLWVIYRKVNPFATLKISYSYNAYALYDIKILQ